MVPYDSKVGYSPKHPEVLRINPKKQVPVLVHGAVEIFDSTQIFEYLEDIAPSPPLWPRDPAARARARGLEHRSDEVFFPHIIRLMSLQDALQTEPAVTAIEAANRYYAEMDQLLDSSDWLAGSYSFADIAFYMAALFGERQGAPLTASTPRLLAWRERMGAARAGESRGQRDGDLVAQCGAAGAGIHGDRFEGKIAQTSGTYRLLHYDQFWSRLTSDSAA